MFALSRPVEFATVGNTWVVDLRRYLTLTGALAEMPSRARLIAEYFASIVVDATTNLDDPHQSVPTLAETSALYRARHVLSCER